VAEAIGDALPVGPVNSIAAIVADGHPHARQMLVDVEQPGSATPVTIAGVPIKLAGTPGGIRRRAPRLGEHQHEILAAVGSGRGSAAGGGVCR
jgi:crotonobetainyl-CoA:carnitine CoA-transferase CaiB-like acyl-CoA transferase